MKFGQNLEQYSVPQWAPYNLDYGNVKKIIRHATLPDAARAIVIPGYSNDTSLAEGPEQELYLTLTEELERVELFSKTKYGEIQRRLEHHEKLLEKLNSKSTKISVKRLQRLAKLEEGIVKAGQDLQLLSRFIGANRLAFIKLLKKYKKWSGSAKLVQQFRHNQLDRCEFLSEVKDPLTVLLARYTRLLELVRIPFDTKSHDPTKTPLEPTSRKTHILQDLFEDGTQTDFDSEFMASASSDADSAIYWIHEDNLVQVHVLLRSVSNQRRPSSADTPTSPLKATTNPLGTFGDNFDGSGMIIFGNPDSITSISPSQDEHAYVHYTKSDKAITLRLPDKRITLKRKEVVLLLHTDDMIFDNNNATAIGVARSWFRKNPSVKPLVEIGYSRTRFAGLSNANVSGVWAILDEHVVFARPGGGHQYQSFPYAILQIQWDGQTPDIVRTLDHQATAERVQGFDMRVHALATINPEMQQPEWSKMLVNDLRRMSSDNKTSHADLAARAKKSSATTASDQSYPFSTGQNHSSATSTQEVPEVFETARRARQKRLQHQTSHRAVDEPQVRYWNEFDDGDEEMQSTQPHSTDTYPVEEDILVSMFAAAGRKMKNMATSIGLVEKDKTPEQEPLLSPSTSLSSRGVEDTMLHSTRIRNYNAIAGSNSSPVIVRKRFLISATGVMFLLAIACVATAFVLDSQGRYKRFQLDPKMQMPITFFTLGSFLLASSAATCGYLGIQGRSVIGRYIVVLCFLIICITDTFLLVSTWAGSG